MHQPMDKFSMPIDYQNFLHRFKNIETEISELKAHRHYKKTEKSAAISTQSLLAENVTSVVGLQEALTSPRSSERAFLFLSILVGLTATVWFVYASTAEYLADPTATKVELVQDSPYIYPPLLVCPDKWLDIEKARSLGFSSATLKYSLGYFNSLERHSLENASAAREEFLDQFRIQQFKSLEEYFERIAIDIHPTSSLAGFFAYDREFSASSCTNCEQPQGGGNMTTTMAPKKLLFGQGICYEFRMTSEPFGMVREPHSSRMIVMRVGDRTEGLNPSSTSWRLYATQNRRGHRLRFSASSMLYVQEFDRNYVRVDIRRIIRVKSSDPKSTCVQVRDGDEVDGGGEATYSSDRCYAQCVSEIFYDTFGCYLYERTVASEPIEQEDPRGYCNFYDLFTDGNSSDLFAQRDRMNSVERLVTESDGGDRCVRDCPFECDRFVFDISLRYRIHQSAEIESIRRSFELDKRSNMPTVMLRIEHGAVANGGVMTMTEINTISFTSMIGNLGGALGLFIGATMMTVMQIVLCVAKWVVVKCL